ncbi:MAG TPA: protein kinase [Kofleriaceae bacterium]
MTPSRRASTLAETTPFSRTHATLLAATMPFARAREVTIGEAFGPYVVYEKLGEGGMAYVHRAELVGDGDLRKPVALKRLLTHAAEDPDFVAAFVHEAQLAAKLRHPNIAQAYDLGRIDNTYYIAMELVPGPTLAQVMAASHDGAGAIPLPIALEILIQLCDALDHAHDLRDDGGRPLDLVHRDVSPMNVIISKTGIVKLIDFGIAKDRSARRQTQTGIIKGKHAYIAPEYTYGQLDRRADLFGLGIVAHELLTGRRLFAGETAADTIHNVRTLNVAPPSRYAAGISPQLDAIVLKALERDPEQRWQNAGDMRSALTEERHRLGVAVTGKQIREWAEWAFRQTPRSDSHVDKVLDGCEPSLSVSIEIECPPVRRAVVAAGSGPTSVPEPSLALGSGPTQQMPTPAPRMATVAPRRSSASRMATAAQRAETALAVKPPVIAAQRRQPRAPRWRPPTRWAHPPKRRSFAPLMLFVLVGLAAFLVSAGYIDVERWREILEPYLS